MIESMLWARGIYTHTRLQTLLQRVCRARLFTTRVGMNEIEDSARDRVGICAKCLLVKCQQAGHDDAVSSVQFQARSNEQSYRGQMIMPDPRAKNEQKAQYFAK